MNKAELLNDLHKEYQGWEALLAEIGEARMEESGVAGHWSIKDIVAHLTGWRRRTVARFQAAVRGEPTPPPPWPAHLQSDDEINDWIYEANRDRSVRQVLDDSDQVFRQLATALEALPDDWLEPERSAEHFPWLEGQPLSAALLFGHFHEEHEPDMRAWLAREKE
jgi:hypothetical protein